MNDTVRTLLSLDLMPVLAAIFASGACGVLGNFLVLRRQSMMGDAVSHSVLPGLILAFLLTNQRDPLTMFVGAALSGVATVVLVEVVRRYGRVEPGAAMGVVFCVFFALGVLLIEQQSVRSVDLDAGCVLYGQLETLFWIPPDTWADAARWSTAESVPRQVWTLAAVFAASLVFVTVFFKELRIAAFDPAMARAQGIPAGALHYVFMAAVASAVVASFEAVGSILVVAMLVCPAATGRLLTDRLRTQVVLSVVIAVVTAVLGYALATAVPAAFGADSVNAAGSMAVTAGVLLTGAVFFSPSYGIVGRAIRRRRTSAGVALDDLLAAAYRITEATPGPIDPRGLGAVLGAARARRAVALAQRAGLIEPVGHGVGLTEQGLARARGLVRSHRLWERYLVDEAGLAEDHVHGVAHRLEHTGVVPDSGAVRDPHGREIPPQRGGQDGAAEE